MDSSPIVPLRDRWNHTLGSLGIRTEQAEAAFQDLIKAYDGPGRYYHNLDHLEAILRVLDRFEDQADDRPALELAAWFHDAVYDPRSSENEARSAALARTVCEGWGLSASRIERIASLILATQTHQAETDNRDVPLLLDADLAILGAPEAEYGNYALCIRREYAWVAEQDYRRGRARILRQFLDRPRIYRTDRMWEDREVQARRNLAGEIAALERL